MSFDAGQFLDALARYLVAQAAAMTPVVVIPYATTPRGLWIHNAEEQAGATKYVTDVFSVIRLYDGSAPYTPVLSAAVQIETLAPKGQDAAGLTRAQTLFNALLDSAGRPARMVMILAPATGVAGYRLNAADPRVPGLTRRDENGRGVWTFNVELKIAALSAI